MPINAWLGTRMLHIEPTSIQGGKSATIEARIIPSFFYWLNGGRSFDLRASCLRIRTVFGSANLPLEPPSIGSDYKRQAARIEEYVTGIKRRLEM